MERGSLDAAIISKLSPINKMHQWHDIAFEPLELLTSEELVSNDPVYLLKNNPFIRFSREAVVGKFIDTWLQDQNIIVTDIMELESLEAISSMVLSNLGVSIVPKRCVQNMNPLPLKRIELSVNAPIRQLGIISPINTIKPRVIEEVHKVLLEAVKIGHFTKTPPRKTQ